MLKGYASYDWHKSLAEQGVSYVTRMRDNAKFEVTASHAIEADSGILRDETINYTSLRSSKKQLIPVRRMVFHDAGLDKDYVFTTNRFDWPASLLAMQLGAKGGGGRKRFTTRCACRHPPPCF